MESVGSAIVKSGLLKNMPPFPAPDEPYVSGQSPTIGTLVASLINVQRELKPVSKDKENPFFNSRYADLGACMEAATEAYNKHDIAVIQRPLDTDGSTICIETILMHVSGEFISGILRLKPVKADPQGLGSCLTYARRYALGAITGLITEEDDDGNAASKPAALKPLPKPPMRSAHAPAAPPPPPPPVETAPDLDWLPTASVGYLKAITQSKKLTQKGHPFGDMTIDFGNGTELTVTWFGFSEGWTFEDLRDSVCGTDRAVFYTVIPPSNPKYKPTLEHLHVDDLPDAAQ